MTFVVVLMVVQLWNIYMKMTALVVVMLVVVL